MGISAKTYRLGRDIISLLLVCGLGLLLMAAVPSAKAEMFTIRGSLVADGVGTLFGTGLVSDVRLGDATSTDVIWQHRDGGEALVLDVGGLTITSVIGLSTPPGGTPPVLPSPRVINTDPGTWELWATPDTDLSDRTDNLLKGDGELGIIDNVWASDPTIASGRTYIDFASGRLGEFFNTNMFVDGADSEMLITGHTFEEGEIPPGLDPELIGYLDRTLPRHFEGTFQWTLESVDLINPREFPEVQPVALGSTALYLASGMGLFAFLRRRVR